MKNIKPLFLPALYQESAAQGRMVLRDGSTATVRVAQMADSPAVVEFYRTMSPESRRRRFFSESKPGLDMIESLCDSSDPRKLMTLLVSRVTDGADRIIATGSYIAHNETTAEFAVAVDDAFQGKGIGALILERLSVLAVNNGFVHFLAITNPNNQAMLETFRNSGFDLREQFKDGLVQIDLSVMPREQSVAISEMRDRISTAASIRPFFKPNAVAVVGASREPGSIGYRLMEQLISHRFRGPVYPIHPDGGVIFSIRALASVREIPEPVDLAFLVVPKEQVLGVVDDCAARGVKAVVVLSSGFAEAGEEGRALQRQLVEKIRGYGMRLVGPNCLGLINTEPAVQLGGSFSPTYPKHGSVAMSSQSGALGIAVLELATKLNLGPVPFYQRGQQGGRDRQRPAAILGGRSAYQRDPALPGVLREPAPLRPPGPPGQPDQAHRVREIGPHQRGHPRRQLADRGPGRQRRGHGGALSADRRDPRGDAGGDVRPRGHPGPPAPAARQARGHRDQRGRARASCVPTPARRAAWRFRRMTERTRAS
jgi:predicted CoA-binding protein/L-amino acid N-acyltransferase YncA